MYDADRGYIILIEAIICEELFEIQFFIALDSNVSFRHFNLFEKHLKRKQIIGISDLFSIRFFVGFQ